MVIALAAGIVAAIIAGGALLVLALIAFAIWAHQYTNVGPNEVLIISGRRGRRKPGYRIVRGGGTYVRPFREKVQRLSLELMQFDVRSAETYTMHGVAVQVDGVCMVKVNSSDEGIEHAATQFLSRGREDIVRTAMQAVEGHLRGAIGALSIEDIYRERQRLVAAVRTLAGPDLERMGLEIVSLTVRNVTDKQGYLEALRDGVVTPSREQFSSLHEEVERLVRLARSLDSLAATNGEHGPAAALEIDLEQSLLAAVDVARPGFDIKAIRFQTRIPSGLRARTDPDRAAQVLSNLLQNAVRYTPREGRVSLSAEARRDGVVVTVENSGEGIPAADLPRVFERFYRVDKSRDSARGGAGVGLAIVKQLIEADGGEVGADSAPGLTRVWFRLPA